MRELTPKLRLGEEATFRITSESHRGGVNEERNESLLIRQLGQGWRDDVWVVD